MRITSPFVSAPIRKMIPTVYTKQRKYVSYVIERIGRMLSFKERSKFSTDTTIVEQVSYIVITVRETVSILLERSFPQKSIKLWKLRKSIKWLKKHG